MAFGTIVAVIIGVLFTVYDKMMDKEEENESDSFEIS